MSFLDLWAYRLYNIWEHFRHYFFKLFFCLHLPLSFGGSNCMHVRPLKIVPHVTELLYFNFSLFSLLKIVLYIWKLSVTLSSGSLIFFFMCCLIFCLVHPVSFLFKIMYFSTLKASFCLTLFLLFLFLLCS